MASFFPEVEEPLPGLRPRFTRLPSAAACLALLDLTVLDGKTGDAPLAALLSPEEQTLFAALTFPKRRREWLGGRLAGKVAVLRLDALRVPMAGLSILPAAHGAPLLSCPALPTWRLPVLSISHSDRYVVALAARTGHCGIDLQRITGQTVRVADRFAEPAELELLRQRLPDLDEVQRLTLLWTAKEALKKGVLSDRPVLFLGVSLQAVHRDRILSLYLRYPGDGGQAALISAVALEGYFLASTVGLDHA